MIIYKVSLGVILLVFLAAPAMASLVPLNFGFPVMVQSGQTSSFSNDFASFTDRELVNIDFGVFNSIMSQPAVTSWPAQGTAMPGFNNMGKLFDLSGFKLH